MTTIPTPPTARAPQVLDRPRFALLARLATRLAATPRRDESVLAAVAVLTADADPARAARLAPRPGEPPALVERLAVWALHRAGDDAVERAAAILDQPLADVAPGAEGRSAARAPVRAPVTPAGTTASVAPAAATSPVAAAACGPA